MRRILKIGGLTLALLLILAQFYQPEKNVLDETPRNDMLTTLGASSQVAELLGNSCYDCHSNHTSYPWYDHISPVSWILARHVESGKEELNFHEFAQMKPRKMIGTLSSICELIESGEMPLKSYLFMHREAKLDDVERKIICEWTDSEADKIMKLASRP